MSFRKLAWICSLAFVMSATPLLAQHVGFQIAIAPTVAQPIVVPGFSQPMFWPPGTVMPAAAPFLPTQAPVVIRPGGFAVASPFVAYPPQVQQVVVPYAMPYWTPYATPYGFPYATPYGTPYAAPYFAPTVVIRNDVPQAHFGPPITTPAAGTPRAQVIRQFGSPSVTIITRSGETLYFNGGVTVIIQNGQVAGPR